MKTTYIYYLELNGSPIYVGKSNNPKHRLYTDHYNNFGYGITQYIIDEVNRDEWRFWEQFYIDLFNSWGFELKQQKKGGGGVCHHSKHSIDKIKKAQIGRDYSYLKDKQRCIKISKNTKGKKKTGDLSHLKDPKRCNKISNSRLGNPHPQKSRKIIQMSLSGDFIKEWDSSKEAALVLNLHQSLISTVCRGKQNKTGGFKFKYK